MAILAMIRAPQPKGFYSSPDSVANDGLFRGWTFPRNTGNFVNILFYLKAFGTAAFAGSPAVMPGTRSQLPARWGRLRGAMAFRNPPVP